MRVVQIDSHLLDSVAKKIQRKLPKSDLVLKRDEIRKCLVSNRQILHHLSLGLSKTEINSVTNCVIKEINYIYGNYTKIDRQHIMTLLDLKNYSAKVIDEVLRMNKSTADRLPNYSSLYKKIFTITGKPTSILDLACGINPLSYHYMRLDNVKYTAVDYSTDHLKICKKFFRTRRIDGRIIKKDLVQDNLRLAADICFVFEFMDLVGLDTVSKIINQVDAKWFVFSSPSLIIKDARYKRKQEFEKSFKFKNFKFKKFKLGKETFYLIRKRAV